MRQSLTAKEPASFELSPDEAIHARMKNFMLTKLKWTHRELHDAVLSAKMGVPCRPSLMNYFNALRVQFGDATIGFLPQAHQSHTKKILQEVLRSLAKSGIKLGGKLTDAKPVLAERLARWLAKVVEMGREDVDAQCGSEEGSDEDFMDKPDRKASMLLLPTVQPGEIPHDAWISPEQAESALGRNLANTLDEELFEAIDADQRFEEEALMGRHVNPKDVDYSCLCWSPLDQGRHSVSAEEVGWPDDIPTRCLSKSDFTCVLSNIVATLNSSIDNLYMQFQKDLDSDAAERQLANDLATLDPTQFEAYRYISEWAEQRRLWSQALPTPSTLTPPKCRLLLLGTAGTGKTHTAKICITKARRTLGSFQSVLTVAFSGVAAGNIGGGARTIDSVFHTNADSGADDLKGNSLDDLVCVLRDVELLVIDEISTVGAASFELISRRLEQVGKVLWLERFGRAQTMPNDLGGFGGIGVVLIGDFAQLPPVLSSSLLPGVALQEGKHGGLRTMALTGRQTFAEFEDVLRLRRIHRILGQDPFKESTMRLRDAAITVEDHLLWKTHEVESLEPDAVSSSGESWVGSESLLREALVLVTDNAQAGSINGQRLTEGVPLLSEPKPLNASSIVVRCEATHNDVRGERPKADEFRNVRKAVHLRVGAKVILISNKIWGVNTVPLGLMNGARGVAVAFIYANKGEIRVDGHALGTTGWPSSDGISFPRGLDHCPMPDFVVVHFPTYKGKSLLPGLPKTWVPIPCIEVQASTRKGLCRIGLPLKLAWCLTIHKCQGITAHEGSLVSFKDSRMPKAVAKLGLAFVAWTRATSWAKVAFQALPPLEDFLAVRLTKDFQARESFEIQADTRHDEFLSSRGISQDSQLAAHRAHLHASLLQKEAREPTEAEHQDLQTMLQQHGVAPVSDSVRRWGQDRVGRKAGGGLWTIISSFRADKSAKDLGDKKRKQLSKEKAAPPDLPSSCTRALLKDHGYDDETIEESIANCGCSVVRCVEFCLDKNTNHSVAIRKPTGCDQPVDETDWAFELIHELGFDEDITTKALEATDFVVQDALTLLLNGNDDVRNKYRGSKSFRRQTNCKTMSLDLTKTAGDDVRTEYSTRARDHFHCDVKVLDFGMYAGETTNACFWLALAAGLAKSAWQINTQALPGLSDSVEVLQRVRAMPLCHLHLSQGVRLSPLGLLAEKLRRYMCAGSSAILLKPAVQARLFPAFAAIDSRSGPRELQHYKQWVARLADKEFADELVLLAVVLELGIRIVAIPYTPNDSACKWCISTYGSHHDIEVVVGNNDVHFMWIAKQ